MELIKLENDFAVCKIRDLSLVDFSRDFIFLAKTDEEISLVCDLDAVPDNATDVESAWAALKICGTLDFGMVGVIAKISNILAEAGLSLFVISTYNTDFILIKKENCSAAVQELLKNGYNIS